MHSGDLFQKHHYTIDQALTITVEKLDKSVKELPNNRTSGIVGTVYQQTEDKNSMSMKAFQTVLHTGTLSKEQSRGILNVIPKKRKGSLSYKEL